MRGGLVKGEAFMEASAIGDEKCVGLSGTIKTVAATTVGAGAGVIGAIAGITATAVVLEVALPVTLCVWAGGITCGAIGLALGIKDRSPNGKAERREYAGKG